jgi:hypothetical protein
MYKDSIEEYFCDMYKVGDESKQVAANNWKPGQRLNTAAEVMRALLDGEDVTDNVGNTFRLMNGMVCSRCGTRTFMANKIPFTIYTPPKRKVKQEVIIYVNVYPGHVRVYELETAAISGADYSAAIAVAVEHKFTIEVEVPDGNG